jgi:radical SAM protein with 4Fe4S-binding SPASM domain
VSDYVRRVGGALPGLTPRLAGLDMELTERCDNDCVHCSIDLPAGDAEAGAREMTTAEVEEVLAQAAALGCLQVRFTGGEPLLRPDFERLYLHARGLGMKVLLFTNARQLGTGGAGGRGERLADLLARVPPLAAVEVSVYGMRAESYEAVSQRPGSFAEFRLGLQRLLDRGVPVLVKSALLPPNRAERAELEAWARETVGMTQPVTYAMAFDLRQRHDDPVKDVCIAALRVSPAEVARVLARDREAWRAAMGDVAARLLGPPGDALFPCGASCTTGRSVNVDAYGRAQPCSYVRAPELTLDVVGRDGRAPATLAEAVDRFTRLGELRASDPEYLRRCARCFLKGLCEQCPAKSWTEHGTLDTPVEYLCAVTHAQARLAGWLEEDEVGWNCPEWNDRVSGV